MELGEKLLQARQEAGLSQRQLCGDVITRNMLSQIEHGTARPSMSTLQYLAARLGKPVSWFLEEDMELSPNHGLMAHARRAFAEERWEEARTVLEGFHKPDAVFDREYRSLYAQTTLKAAETAAAKGKQLYARALLTDLESVTGEIPELERARLLLLAAISKGGLAALCRKLPSLDRELYQRSRAALEEKNWNRGLALLDAMEERGSSEWQLLRGRLLLGKKAYAEAAEQLKAAENAYPEETAPLLEHCYRELGDYRKAYFYACAQRKK